ncbi:SH3 domain-containing protein [Croceibacterium sp. TMG7-5b_MA50]|uniref:SH3 domain-containing protein n=1 Tax=Croceibacterium sp. TMG7-5b_MA50 TaxID=3121290 RepID=UPI0032217C11
MRSLLFILAVLLLPATTVAAQERDVPYWASLRADEVYMRVGPSVDFPIEWIYRRAGLPVKVIRLNEGWRLVEDADGARGWIAARLLDPERAALVTQGDLVPMRAAADQSSALRWRLEAGVVGRLGRCQDGWCQFTVGRRSGWVPQGRLWGADAP